MALGSTDQRGLPLRERIEAADRVATRCEHILGALTRQSAEHRAESEQQAQIVAVADAHLTDARAEVATPLIEEATAADTGYLAAQERMWQANRALSATGRRGRRAAARTAREATDAHHTAEDTVRRRWGDVPLTMHHLPAWAEAVAGQRVDADPRVIGAAREAEHAHRQLQGLNAHHADTRAALRRTVGAGQRPSDLEARAAGWRSHADQARRTLAEIEALPVSEAAQLIRDRAVQAAAEKVAESARQARAADSRLRHAAAPVHQPGPQRDFGPSL